MKFCLSLSGHKNDNNSLLSYVTKQSYKYNTQSYSNIHFKNSDWLVESCTTVKLARLQKGLHAPVLHRGRVCHDVCDPV